MGKMSKVSTTADMPDVFTHVLNSNDLILQHRVHDYYTAVLSDPSDFATAPMALQDEGGTRAIVACSDTYELVRVNPSVRRRRAKHSLPDKKTSSG